MNPSINRFLEWYFLDKYRSSFCPSFTHVFIVRVLWPVGISTLLSISDPLNDTLKISVSSKYLFWCFQIAIDSAVNLPWSNFTHAHMCLNPPAAFYLVWPLLSLLEYLHLPTKCCWHKWTLIFPWTATSWPMFQQQENGPSCFCYENNLAQFKVWTEAHKTDWHSLSLYLLIYVVFRVHHMPHMTSWPLQNFWTSAVQILLLPGKMGIK